MYCCQKSVSAAEEHSGVLCQSDSFLMRHMRTIAPSGSVLNDGTEHAVGRHDFIRNERIPQRDGGAQELCANRRRRLVGAGEHGSASLRIFTG